MRPENRDFQAIGGAGRSARLGRLDDGERGRLPPGMPHRVLGLSAGERDPVTIILAAQIRLRRWRRFPGPVGDSVPETARIQAIVRARDAMLREAMSRLGAAGDASAGMS